MSATIDPQNRFEKIRIPRNESANFRDEWRELLLLAFPKANPISVLEPLSGYSDERVWSVATKIDTDTQLFVVKIGYRKRIEREYEKSEKVIGGGLYGNPVTPGKKIDHPTDQRWSLMPSTLAGSDKADTLLTHLTRGDASDMEDILKKVFTDQNNWRENMRTEPVRYDDYYDRLLPEHVRLEGIDGSIKNAIPIDAGLLVRNPAEVYKKFELKGIIELRNFQLEKQEEIVLTLCPQRMAYAGTFFPKVKYELAPGQLVPEDDGKPIFALFGQNPKTRFDLLREYAQGAVPGMKKYKNKKFFSLRNGFKFPDPIEFLQDLLDASANLRLALNHGDLNLQNILVASDKKSKNDQTNLAFPNMLSEVEEKHPIDSVWLIDFADVDRGPALLDFQWLEVQVIMRLLTPAIDETQLPVNKLIELLKALHECDTDFSPQFDVRLRKSYNVLRHIRRFAKEHLVGDWSEYYHGLVICLLGALRFKKLIEKGQLSKSAPRVAFLSAATLICWTGVLSDDDLKRVSTLLNSPTLRPEEQEGIKEPPPTSPTIDETGIPAPIFSGQGFPIRGYAHPASTVTLSADQEPLRRNIKVNADGEWDTTIILNKAGTYALIVRDTTNETLSAAVPVTVIALPNIDLDHKKRSVPELIRVQDQPIFSRRQFFWVLPALILGFTVWLVSLYRELLYRALAGYFPNLFPLLTRKIRIGVALASRGDGSLLGEAQWIGYDIAAQYFKNSLSKLGLEIELIAIDARSSEYDALVAFKDLIDKKIATIIGPTYSKQAETLFNEEAIKALFRDESIGKQVIDLFGASNTNVDSFVAELKKIPVIGPSNTADNIATLSPYNVRVSAPVAKYADFAFMTVINTFTEIKNIAITYLDDPFTISEAKVFRGAVEENASGRELTLVFDQPHQPTDFNDPQFVDRLVKDVLRKTPDLVIVLSRPTHGAEIVKRLRSPDNNYPGKIIGGNGMNAPGIFTLSDWMCDGMYIAQAYNYALDNPMNTAFKKEYNIYREGLEKDDPDRPAANLPYPSQLTAQMFTAVQIFVEAIQKVEPTLIDSTMSVNGQKLQSLRDAILDQILGHTFETPLGKISFDETEGEIAQDVFCVAELWSDNNEPQFKRIRNSGNNCREPEPE